MLATAHLDGQTGKRVHSKAPGKVCNLKAGTGNCSYMWLLPESQALGGSNGLRVRPQAGSTGEALRDPKQSSDRQHAWEDWSARLACRSPVVCFWKSRLQPGTRKGLQCLLGRNSPCTSGFRVSPDFFLFFAVRGTGKKGLRGCGSPSSSFFRENLQAWRSGRVLSLQRSSSPQQAESAQGGLSARAVVWRRLPGAL